MWKNGGRTEQRRWKVVNCEAAKQVKHNMRRKKCVIVLGGTDASDGLPAFTTDNIDTTPNGLGAISALMINFRVNKRSFRRLKNIQNVQHIIRKKTAWEEKTSPSTTCFSSFISAKTTAISKSNEWCHSDGFFFSRDFLSFWYFYNCCQTRAWGDILFSVAVSSSRRVIHNIFLAVSLLGWQSLWVTFKWNDFYDLERKGGGGRQKEEGEKNVTVGRI